MQNWKTLGCDTQMVKEERRSGKICKNYIEGCQDNHNTAFAEGNFTFSLILNPNSGVPNRYSLKGTVGCP